MTDFLFYVGIFCLGSVSGFTLAALSSVIVDPHDDQAFQRLADLCVRQSIQNCTCCWGSGVERWDLGLPERCSECKHIQSSVYREIEQIRSAA